MSKTNKIHLIAWKQEEKYTNYPVGMATCGKIDKSVLTNHLHQVTCEKCLNEVQRKKKESDDRYKI